MEAINSCQINYTTGRVSIEGDYIYVRYGANNTDTVGDLRIFFNYTSAETPITVVAMQTNGAFSPYNVKQLAGEGKSDEERAKLAKEKNETDFFSNIPVKVIFCCCYLARKCLKNDQNIYWIFEDRLNKKDAFDKKFNENESDSWGYRIGAFLLMVLGVYCSFSPVVAALSLVGFLETLGSWAALLFSILVSLLFSTACISISWSFYNIKKAIFIVLFGIPASWLSVQIIKFIIG
jgi:hypothetical protein